MTDTTAWLIERGQAEQQVPTVWWADRRRWGMTYMDDWTSDAFKAFRFDSREAAEEVIAAKFTPPASRGGPSARAVEHGFIEAAASPSRAPEGATVTELTTPATEAGRRVLATLKKLDELTPAAKDAPINWAYPILAIEAEARADALRDAAERVWALQGAEAETRCETRSAIGAGSLRVGKTPTAMAAAAERLGEAMG